MSPAAPYPMEWRSNHCFTAGRECRILWAVRGVSSACLPQLAEPVLQ
jgi:hypothetical protein